MPDSLLLQRAYYQLCLTLGHLLRASRYSQVQVVCRDGVRQVRKSRTFYSPLLVWLGRPLMAVLGTGVRVLPQREWEQRERQLWQGLYDRSIDIEGNGTLVLPFLAGETLAALLESSKLEAPLRSKAIELAVIALAEFHQRGFTHGDAMAENVMIDLDARSAHWFDFETVHDPRRPVPWRRADDLRALLATCLLRTEPDKLADTLALILDTYPDEEVTRFLANSFETVAHRSLTFHLAQAGLFCPVFRQIGVVLRATQPRPLPTDRETLRSSITSF